VWDYWPKCGSLIIRLPAPRRHTKWSRNLARNRLDRDQAVEKSIKGQLPHRWRLREGRCYLLWLLLFVRGAV
jgi:hypothetical protein